MSELDPHHNPKPPHHQQQRHQNLGEHPDNITTRPPSNDLLNQSVSFFDEVAPFGLADPVSPRRFELFTAAAPKTQLTMLEEAPLTVGASLAPQDCGPFGGSCGAGGPPLTQPRSVHSCKNVAWHSGSTEGFRTLFAGCMNVQTSQPGADLLRRRLQALSSEVVMPQQQRGRHGLARVPGLDFGVPRRRWRRMRQGLGGVQEMEGDKRSCWNACKIHNVMRVPKPLFPQPCYPWQGGLTTPTGAARGVSRASQTCRTSKMLPNRSVVSPQVLEP